MNYEEKHLNVVSLLDPIFLHLEVGLLLKIFRRFSLLLLFLLFIIETNNNISRKTMPLVKNIFSKLWEGYWKSFFFYGISPTLIFYHSLIERKLYEKNSFGFADCYHDRRILQRTFIRRSCKISATNTKNLRR